MRWTIRAGLALAACWLMASTPAAQADEVDLIDHIESSEGTVRVLVAVDNLPPGTPVLDGWDVTVNGEAIDGVEAEPVDSGEAEVERTTVIALDASNSMRGEPFTAAKAAASAFIDAAPGDIHIGLVTFGGDVNVVSEPTDDRALLTDRLDALDDLTRSTHLYDGVLEAAAIMGEEGFRSVLVLSDGKDRGSEASLEEVVTGTDNGVVVDVVALEQASSNRALLERMADETGGRVIDANSPEALTQLFEAQAEALESQVLLQFPQPADAAADTSVSLALAVNGQTFTDEALVSLAPMTGTEPKPVDRSGSGVGSSALLGGAVALGVGLAAILAVLFLGSGGGSRAQRQITEYFGSAEPGGNSAGSRASGPTQTSLRESAVAVTEKVVKGGDLETRLNARLVGGGVALTPAEWLLIHAGIAIVGAFVGFVAGGAVFMVVGLIAGVLLPYAYLRRKHSKRLAAFNSQLAETLDLIAGGLAAGLSMPQAVDTVVREGVDPMAGELRRALIEQRLGVDITDALEGVAERMDSGDFSWVVMAIRIQREVGGNLAELMRTVADTLREREYLRRQVRVLSAEGRFSAWVLGALPIAMFLYMLAFRRDFVVVLWTTTTGIILLLIAIGMLLAGFWVMSRLVKIEV